MAWDERVEYLFELVARVLVYVVALFLIFFAVLALVDTVALIKDPILVDHDYTRAITLGIDTAFLTVILLELLHTVVSRGPISRQLQEFLVIGITSAVRHSLEIAAGGSGPRTENRLVCTTVGRVLGHTQQSCRVLAVSVPGPTSRDVVIDLAINAVGVLILVAALWLVRQQTGIPLDERMDGDGSSPGQTEEPASSIADASASGGR
jgi:hypothetical protein